MTHISKRHIYEGKNERILAYAPTEMEEGKTALVQTTTGEPLMPVRLYFKFLNRKRLVKALSPLRCLEWDDDDHFIIAYWEEARHFPLSVACDDVPEDIFPILLAQGRICSTDVHIDLRSFRRAAEMARFLYRHIGPRFLYITHVATYNRYLDVSRDTFLDWANMDFDEIFLDEKIHEEDLLDQDELEASMHRAIPVIQKLAVRGTKDGLAAMEMTLMINLLFAREYADGNTDCTLLEIIEKIAGLIHEADVGDADPEQGP